MSTRTTFHYIESANHPPVFAGTSQQKLVDVDDRDGPVPQYEYTCVCGHTNRSHKKRRGDGPYYCSKCSCPAFTWNEDPSEDRS